jgi:hypothetical protein
MPFIVGDRVKTDPHPAAPTGMVTEVLGVPAAPSGYKIAWGGGGQTDHPADDVLDWCDTQRGKTFEAADGREHLCLGRIDFRDERGVHYHAFVLSTCGDDPTLMALDRRRLAMFFGDPTD